MPNEQKKCCEKCLDFIILEGPFAGECICKNGACPCHTPTEEKIKYTKIAEGTPFEITQIKPTPTEEKEWEARERTGEKPFDTPTVSKMIDIDEVIVMVVENSTGFDTIGGQRLWHLDIDMFEASLKQKLEAKRKEI